MNRIASFVALVLSASLIACDRGETASAAGALAPETAPAPHVEVLSKVAPGNGVAIQLPTSQSVSGRHVMSQGGAVSAFGVRIGTYHGEADGSLRLTLCVDDDCREASQPLAGSRDNDYLVFTVARPLDVARGQGLDFVLTRSSDANKRVAIWSYPKPEGQPGLVDPSGTAIDRVARLSIRLQ